MIIINISSVYTTLSNLSGHKVITSVLFIGCILFSWYIHHYSSLNRNIVIKRFLFRNENLRSHPIITHLLIYLDIIFLLLLFSFSLISIFINISITIAILIVSIPFSIYLYYYINYPKLIMRDYIPIYRSYNGDYYVIDNVIHDRMLVIHLTNGDLNTHSMTLQHISNNDERFITDLTDFNNVHLYIAKNNIN